MDFHYDLAKTINRTVAYVLCVVCVSVCGSEPARVAAHSSGTTQDIPENGPAYKYNCVFQDTSSYMSGTNSAIKVLTVQYENKIQKWMEENVN